MILCANIFIFCQIKTQLIMQYCNICSGAITTIICQSCYKTIKACSLECQEREKYRIYPIVSIMTCYDKTCIKYGEIISEKENK